MGWWESFVVTVTLLTVFGRLRWKRSEHAEPNSPHYSRSSQPTAARRTLLEPHQTEGDRVFHVSYCPHCDARDAVPFAETALERSPWRVTWKCVRCGKQAEALVPAPLVDDLQEFDRPGGSRISDREYRKFVSGLSRLDQAVQRELT